MADIQFNLRIPAELKDRIAEAAKENNRSINAEAQSRLEQSFDKKNIDLSDLIARQEETIEYIRSLHEQNKELSEQLQTAQEYNKREFGEMKVLRGLDAVARREIPLPDSSNEDNPKKNWQNLNPNNRKK